jgi:hypothetical protein
MDISGSKRRLEEKLQNKEFHDLLSSQNIIPVIKSKRMVWAGNMATMRTKRNA